MQYEPGYYYHAYNRGNNKQTIFYEESDYLSVIGLFQKNTPRFEITLIAYCLMPNHYHLLLRQEGDTPISRFMQSTFQSYSQSFNNRYNRTGRLYDNPNPPKHVDDTAYLFQVCRYIHRNPLDAHLVNDLADWPYSNYPEYIDQRDGTLVPRDLVAEWFGSPEEYRKFVESGDEDYDDLGPYLFD